MIKPSIKLIRPLLLVGIIYCFFIGIVLLGSSFKLLGGNVAQSLMQATSNPLVGLFVGMLVTALVQSSSVTTSMVVALVSSGTLSITNAVPIIMGANIGTTVTNIIVSVGHITRQDEFERANAAATVHDFFNVMAVLILLPLELLTGFISTPAKWLAKIFFGYEGVLFSSPLKLITKPVVHKLIDTISDFGLSNTFAGIVGIILSLVFIFLSLTLLVKILKAIFETRVEGTLSKALTANPYIAIMLGAAVTAIIQSSSLTTSFLVPLVASGILTIEHAYPFTLGANVGTTATAIMASLAGNQAGLAIAFVHLLFNIYGIVLFFPIKCLRKIPIICAKKLAVVSARNKKVVLVFLIGFFFVIPLLGIFILG